MRGRTYTQCKVSGIKEIRKKHEIAEVTAQIYSFLQVILLLYYCMQPHHCRTPQNSRGSPTITNLVRKPAIVHFPNQPLLVPSA